MTQRERTVRWHDANAIVEAARALPGRALLDALLAGDVPRPPVMDLLDFRLVEAADGRVVVEYAPHESHYNPMGTVQGGVISAVFDAALGCAIHSRIPRGTTYTTLELSTSYVRPVLAGTGPLRCEAAALHVGRSMATAHATLKDPGGKLFAHGTTTCLVLTG